MKSLNKVQLIGNLGKDPELKSTNTGISVASFTLATSEQWKDESGTQKEKTEWHNIVAWRKLAEICGQYLKKGQRVYIEGKVTYETSEKDGVKKYFTKIVADQMIMLGDKHDAENKTETHETPYAVVTTAQPSDIGLPF